MTRRTLLVAASYAACLACQNPEPVEPRAPVTTASAAPAVTVAPVAATSPPSTPPASTDVVAAFAFMPEALAIDGRLDEWLLPDDVAAQRTVLVAVSPTKLVIAASLPALVESEISVAIASAAPSVPDVGWAERGGSIRELTDERCQFEQISLPEGYWERGKQQPPEVVEACRAIMQRQADYAASYLERFVRRFRLTGSAVHALDAHGEARPIDGAVHAAVKGTIEVQLPISSLPRLAQAPLMTLFVKVAEGKLPADLTPPRGEDDTQGWSSAGVLEPVEFAPHAALRAAIFADLGIGYHHPDFGELSFHPSTPDTIELARAERWGPGVGGAEPITVTKVVQSEQRIFTRLAELGDVEVGVAHAHKPFLATYHKGVFVSATEFFPVAGKTERAGALHVFGYDAGGFSWSRGAMYSPPRWWVYAVKRDGTVEDIADEGVDSFGMWNAWDDYPKTFFDPDFRRVGLRGIRKKRPKTVIWRWNDAEGKYTSSVTPKDQAADWGVH